MTNKLNCNDFLRVLSTCVFFTRDILPQNNIKNETANKPSEEKQFRWRSLNEDDEDMVGTDCAADIVRCAGEIEGDCWQATGRTFDWQEERPESISNESLILSALNPRSAVVDADISSVFFECSLPQLSSKTSKESSVLIICSSGAWVIWLSLGYVTGNMDVLSQGRCDLIDFRRSWEFVTAVWYSVRLLPRRLLPWSRLGNGCDVEYCKEWLLTLKDLDLKHSFSSCSK